MDSGGTKEPCIRFLSESPKGKGNCRGDISRSIVKYGGNVQHAVDIVNLIRFGRW